MKDGVPSKAPHAWGSKCHGAGGDHANVIVERRRICVIDHGCCGVEFRLLILHRRRVINDEQHVDKQLIGFDVEPINVVSRRIGDAKQRDKHRREPIGVDAHTSRVDTYRGRLKANDERGFVITRNHEHDRATRVLDGEGQRRAGLKRCRDRS